MCIRDRYRKADIGDLHELVRSRLMVLRAANGLDEGAELPEVKSESDAYYRRALADGSHVAYLAYDGDVLIGTGGVRFFQVLPTCHNPSGQKAYIMNMYTEPGYRRRGIARRMVAVSYTHLHRIRMCIWKQWKKPKTKVKNLRKMGVPEDLAWQAGNKMCIRDRYRSLASGQFPLRSRPGHLGFLNSREACAEQGG